MLTEDFPKFPHVKTEECRTPAEIVENKCEDCILKCEDPKINSGWLDPLAKMLVSLLLTHICFLHHQSLLQSYQTFH